MKALRIALPLLLAVPAMPPAAAADVYFNIVGTQSAKCLDVAAVSGADGANVQLWECKGFGQPNQFWRLVPAGAGFQIVARHSNKCLDIGGVSVADGANVVQWTCIGATQLNQQFLIVPSTDVEAFEIRPVHSQKCLDVDGYGTANGSNVHQWTCHGGPNQHWYLVGPFVL